MAKQVNLIAEVDTTALLVNVTAAAGSAGTAIPVSTASSTVTLTDISLSGGVEYQVGSGAWNYLEKNEGNVVNANLSSTTIKLRLIADGSTSVPVDVSIDSIPTIRQYPGGPSIGSAGASLFHASSVLANATPLVVALGGAAGAIYRAYVNPASGDSILVESGVSVAGPWVAWPPGAVATPTTGNYLPDLAGSAVTHLRFTRTAGAGVTSRYYVDEISNGA